MKIQVNFYKSSGKWYAGGEVEVGDARLWRGDLLGAIWRNQGLLGKSTDERSWTVVTSSLPEHEMDPEYDEFFDAVLQVGREDRHPATRCLPSLHAAREDFSSGEGQVEREAEVHATQRRASSSSLVKVQWRPRREGQKHLCVVK